MKVLKKALAVAFGTLVALSAFGGCVKHKEKQFFSIYMPDGAPAMAFAKMMQEDTDKNAFEYVIVAPAVIASKVTNENQAKNADICALPITAASKLLGGKEDYQMLGVVTSGNLCLLSKNETVISAFETTEPTETAHLSHLIGKTVGVMQMNNMPGYTFKSILNEYGVPWQVLGNDGVMAEDKVNLKAIADATAINPADTSVACYLVAEPAASVQVQKKGFSYVSSVETLYYKGQIPMNCTGPSYAGYPQAVLVAKRSLIETESAALQAFMTELTEKSSNGVISRMSGEEIVATITAHQEDAAYKTTLNAGVLTEATIGRCRVGFAAASLSKGAVQAYLQRIVTVDASAAKTLKDSFFYLP